MSDGDAIMEAIRADYFDDLPRLAYADWLDETGEVEARAEFIRTQIALAKLDAEGHGHGHPMPKGHVGGQMASAFCTKCDDHQWLTHRETVLRSFNTARWSCTLVTHPDCHVYYTRGFIDSVRCPLAAWLEHGKAILAAHPVVRVELSDREPHFYDRATSGIMWWTWFNDEVAPYGVNPQCGLSLEIWLKVWCHSACKADYPWAWFRERETALDALSDACLAYARTKGTP